MKRYRWVFVFLLLVPAVSGAFVGTSMGQSIAGERVEYTYTGSKDTVDISNITRIEIIRMEGAQGGDGGSNTGTYSDPGNGGLIKNYTIDVSSYENLTLWVGRDGTHPESGVHFGRSKGGSGFVDNINGGGSTEIWLGNNKTFVASSDGGGGAGGTSAGADVGGGGGARGGVGGNGNSNGGDGTDAQDIDGPGFGGEGGDSGTDPAGDGGTEINSSLVLDSGQSVKGGGNGSHGRITLSYMKTEERYHVNGSVLDTNSEPVGNANVEVIDNGTVVNQTSTQSTGEFHFDLKDGGYNFSVSKSHFETKNKSLTVSGSNVTEYNFTLAEKVYKLEGQVISNKGKNVSSTRVKVLRGSKEVSNTTTGPQGRYNFGLTQGTYSLIAKKSMYESTNSTITLGSNTSNFDLVITRKEGRVVLNDQKLGNDTSSSLVTVNRSSYTSKYRIVFHPESNGNIDTSTDLGYSANISSGVSKNTTHIIDTSNLSNNDTLYVALRHPASGGYGDILNNFTGVNITDSATVSYSTEPTTVDDSLDDSIAGASGTTLPLLEDLPIIGNFRGAMVLLMIVISLFLVVLVIWYFYIRREKYMTWNDS